MKKKTGGEKEEGKKKRGERENGKHTKIKR